MPSFSFGIRNINENVFDNNRFQRIHYYGCFITFSDTAFHNSGTYFFEILRILMSFKSNLLDLKYSYWINFKHIMHRGFQSCNARPCSIRGYEVVSYSRSRWCHLLHNILWPSFDSFLPWRMMIWSDSEEDLATSTASVILLDAFVVCRSGASWLSETNAV